MGGADTDGEGWQEGTSRGAEGEEMGLLFQGDLRDVGGWTNLFLSSRPRAPFW